MKNAYNSAMEYICLSGDARQNIQKALTEGRAGKKSTIRAGRPVHRLAVLAAVLALTVGSAFAVSARLGVLDVFFRPSQAPAQGSQVVEPYVQSARSVSDGSYRLTVDSALLDGRTLYAVVTVTGLDERAAADLKSGRVLAEPNREVWGDEMVEGLLESGGAGPDTFRVTGASGLEIGELAAPDGNSRTFSLRAGTDWIGDADTPLQIRGAFMAEGCAVALDPVRAEPKHLTAPAAARDSFGEAVQITGLDLGATGIHMTASAADSYSDSFSFRLKLSDGTEADPKASFSDSVRLDNDTEDPGDDRYEYNFQFAVPVDPAQVAAVLVSGVEVPVS